MNRKDRHRAAAIARNTRQQKLAGPSRPQSASANRMLPLALIASAAAGAIALANPGPAPAQVVVPPPNGPCVVAGATATCSGDVSSGVDANAPLTSLNINDLTQDIAPAAGVDGINFTVVASDITINSNTGPFAITTTGNGADGIRAATEGGGIVSVTQTGDISTTGRGAAGIYASTAFQYGDISFGNVSVTQLGNISTTGRGGAGIRASTSWGNVSVTQTGDISTTGNLADGIRARSFAGDLSVTQTGDISTMGTGAEGIYASAYVGDLSVTQTGDISTMGTGAEGIAADTFDGDVSVTQRGNISTRGTARGILAYSFAGNVSVAQTGNITTTGISGTGVYAGTYFGNVSVTQTGNISTAGNFAAGIGAGSRSGSVSVTQTGDISTTGNGSAGIGAYPNFGHVSVTQTGSITTTGNSADGIYASPHLGNVAVTQTGNISTTGNSADGISAGSRSGNVSVTQTGNITTTGANAHGIKTLMEGASGNTATVTSTGTISASGNNADGVRAFAAAGNSMTLNLSAGTVQGGTGTGAGVNFNGPAGSSSTLDNAATIRALSGTAVRGGAGDETINNTGTISGNLTLGDGTNVVSNRPGGTISGDLTTGAGNDSATNSGTLAGAFDLGGGTDSLSLDGAGTTTAATFDGGSGADTLVLSGTGANALTGSQHRNFEILQQTGGTWTLSGNHNLATSASILGGTLDLQGNLTAATLSNQATLAAGGIGTVGTSSVTGNFVQSGAGSFALDLDLAAGTADRLDITGTASLAGAVTPNVLTLGLGEQHMTVLSAAGGTSNNGLGLSMTATSPALNLSLLFPNATDVVLASTLDFTAPGSGLNRNQTNLAANLNAAVGAGSGGLEPLLLALVNGPVTIPQYLDALNRLIPEVYLNAETATLFSARAFTDELFSCPLEGRGEAFISEGQCLWVRPRGYDLNFDGTSENIAFDERARGISAGAQYRFAPGWYANLGLGYERGTTETDTGADSDGDRYQIGLAIKYQRGPWLLAGALSGGIAQFETERPIAFAGLPAATARSGHDVWLIAGQLRGAYLLDLGPWYVKPILDLNLTYIDRDALSESGAGAANLSIDDGSETIFSASPAIELGTQLEVAPDAVIKPFIKAGITYLADNDQGLSASFLSAPAGIGGFTVTSQRDDLFADIQAGLAIIKTNDTSLSLGYQGRIGEDTEQHGLYAKVAWRF